MIMCFIQLVNNLSLSDVTLYLYNDNAIFVTCKAGQMIKKIIRGIELIIHFIFSLYDTIWIKLTLHIQRNQLKLIQTLIYVCVCKDKK